MKFNQTLKSKLSKKKETGLVKWCDWEELEEGPFGDYNRALREHLININLI